MCLVSTSKHSEERLGIVRRTPEGPATAIGLRSLGAEEARAIGEDEDEEDAEEEDEEEEEEDVGADGDEAITPLPKMLLE